MLTANPASAYRSIEVSSLLPANGWSGKSYVSFRHLQFRRGKDCVALGNCDYFSFDSCRIGWGICRVLSSGPSRTRTTGSSPTHASTGMTRCNTPGSTRPRPKSTPGRSDGLAIQCGSFWEAAYDTFTTCGHAGVSVNGRSKQVRPTASGHTESKYNKIHNCVFTGGGDYSRAWGCVAYPTSKAASLLCYGNEFYRNLVDGCRTQHPPSTAAEHEVLLQRLCRPGQCDRPTRRRLAQPHADDRGFRQRLVPRACAPASVQQHLPQLLGNSLVSDGPMHASIENNIFSTAATGETPSNRTRPSPSGRGPPPTPSRTTSSTAPPPAPPSPGSPSSGTPARRGSPSASSTPRPAARPGPTSRRPPTPPGRSDNVIAGTWPSIPSSKATPHQPPQQSQGARGLPVV